MLFLANKDCSWTVQSVRYNLKKGELVEIDSKFESHALASGLLEQIESKEVENVKPIKRKTNTKL